MDCPDYTTEHQKGKHLTYEEKNKWEDTAAHTLALSVLVLNPRRAVKCCPDLRAFFLWAARRCSGAS